MAKHMGALVQSLRRLQQLLVRRRVEYLPLTLRVGCSSAYFESGGCAKVAETVRASQASDSGVTAQPSRCGDAKPHCLRAVCRRKMARAQFAGERAIRPCYERQNGGGVTLWASEDDVERGPTLDTNLDGLVSGVERCRHELD